MICDSGIIKQKAKQRTSVNQMGMPECLKLAAPKMEDREYTAS